MTWTIDGVDAPVQSDLELTATTLSISFEAGRGGIGPWRDIGDRAGDIQRESGFGGTFRTLSRGTASTVSVTPSTEFVPPLASGDWLVAGFSEQTVAPERFEVTLELARPSNRQDEIALTEQETTEATEGFGFNFGVNFGAGDPDVVAQLSLRDGAGLTLKLVERQVGQSGREGTPADAAVTLPLLLSDEQAAALIDAAGYPAGVNRRPVSDGDNQIVDSSPGTRQTVDATFDDAISLASGTWLLDEWTLAWYNFDTTRRWLADLTLIQS